MTRRHGFGLAPLLAALLAAPSASAQLGLGDAGGLGSSSGLGISLNGLVNRFKPGAQTISNSWPFRAQNFNPSDINFADCAANIQLQFNMLLSGLPTTDTLQVWAGPTDCTQQSARSGTTGPFCWRVAPNVATTMTSSSTIYARELTQYIDQTLTGVPNSGNPPTPGITPGTGACHTQTSSGAVGITIYFMFIAGDDVTIDASTTYALNVDMVGPLPPTNLTAGVGENLLVLNWDPQTDPTIQQFNIYIQDQGANGASAAEGGTATPTLETPIYCPAGNPSGGSTCPDAASSGDGALTDAAPCTPSGPSDAALSLVSGEAGAALAAESDADLAAQGCQRGISRNVFEAGGPGASACVSNVLVDTFAASITSVSPTDASSGLDAQIVSIPVTTDGSPASGTAGYGISQIADADLAGSVGGNTTSSYTLTTLPNGTPLQDGHQYAVAVASVDDDENVGLLSNLACQTPEPVITFWDAYSSAGGQAGGGFCSLPAAGAPALGSAFGAGLGVCVVVLARRRRRRRV